MLGGRETNAVALGVVVLKIEINQRSLLMEHRKASILQRVCYGEKGVGMFDVLKAGSKVRSLYGHYLLVLSQHNSSNQCLCRDTMAESSNKSHLSLVSSFVFTSRQSD